MSDIISPLLQWLNANPEWAGLVTFIISASESVAIIGTLIPGSITMTAIGTLAGANVIPLGPTIIWAILGAIVGDGISYWMGHAFKNGLRNLWLFRHNPHFLTKGEAFVHKYGVMSVFIGRFVGPVRAVIPLVAGMLGMRPLLFTIANITSAIGWAPVYMLPGILLGAASLELPPDIAVHVMLVLLLIVLFILLCLWFLYTLFQLISTQIEQILIRIWDSLRQSRRFRLATVILKHHDPKQLHGQLTLAFYFLLTSFLFVCLVTYVQIVGPQNILINDVIFHLFRGIRNSGADNIMIDITLLGQKQIVLPVVFVLFGWLIATQRMRAAFHALALGLLAAAGVLIAKYLLHSPRPWGIFSSPETFSMPSGHATLATTVYMGIAFMIATPLPKKYRWMIYTPAALVTLAVGISRLYLGAHWFTDVLAGWLLSAALLIIVILSFHRREEKKISLLSISMVSVASLLLSYAFFYSHHISEIKVNYAQLNWPTTEIQLGEWWQKDEAIPSAHVSLFGFPSQNINIQWIGSLDQIKKTLLSEGWTKPPARDWISTLHRISDIKSSDYLPLVSPQYLDKTPELILAKRINDSNKLLVLRLWESNRLIKETQQPLWVGILGVVPRPYAWLFQKNRPLQVDPTLVFESTSAMKHWQWRLITLNLPMNTHKKMAQKVLLIREKS